MKIYFSESDEKGKPEEDYYRDHQRELMYLQQEEINDTKREIKKFENDITKIKLNDF